MRRIFIFAFNDLMGTQQSVLDFLDTRSEILNWLSVLPHSIFIVSDHDLYQLTRVITDNYPGRFFVISEIKGMTSNGLLGIAAWDFINFPKSSGRWKP